MYYKLTRPAWVEINLDVYEKNISSIKNLLDKDTEIMAIVKSDAYCLGANAICNKLVKFGINYVGVATLSEAISIRKHFKNINILILGYNPIYLMEEAIDYNITSTIYNLQMAKELNNFALMKNKVAKIHIAIDTGMRRIGFIPSKSSLNEIIEISKLSNIEIEGIFTHFSSSDEDDKFTLKQFSTFKNFLNLLKNNDLFFKYTHISNSSAILKYGSFGFNMVRAGIITYGYIDNINDNANNYNLNPIVEIKSEISEIKYVNANESVGYARAFIAKKNMKIATIPIGYSDGFLRMLSGKIDVLVCGKKCRQIGKICMDQMMIDITSINANIGDEVVLIGRQANEEILLKDIAKLTGDIESSFLTHISKRLPKLYIENKKISFVEDIIRNL